MSTNRERWWAAGVAGATVLVVLVIQIWLRPYAHATGLEDYNLLGRAPAFLVGMGVPYLLLARGGELPGGPWARGSFVAGCFWACMIVWGMELLDLLLVGRVFDIGDLVAGLLGVGAAWSFHRTVWSRRFPNPSAGLLVDHGRQEIYRIEE